MIGKLVAASNYIDDCLQRKVIFFTGKGGVGKSALSWATAMACSRRGARVAVTSWNPFDSPEKPLPVENTGVKWLPLETLSAFREYVLHILKFEAVYNAVFDNHVLKTFIKAAPGLPETVISGKIWDLYDKNDYDLILVDLPSSGHAVSFFASPLGVSKVFSVGLVHREAEKIVEMFQNPRARIDLVALPEELPLVESAQLKDKLQGMLPFHFGFLHLNQCLPQFNLPSEVTSLLPAAAQAPYRRYQERFQREQAVQSLATRLALPILRIPRLASESTGETLRQLAHWLESLTPEKT